MPADPIDRREAKEAINAIDYIGEHMKRDLCKVLDKLPALDADGRWEKLRAWIQQVRDDWHHAGDMRKVFAADYILNEVSRVVSAPPAAEHRPAVERQLETLRADVESLQHNRSMDAFTDGYNLAVEAVLSRIDDLTSGDAAKGE